MWLTISFFHLICCRASRKQYHSQSVRIFEKFFGANITQKTKNDTDGRHRFEWDFKIKFCVTKLIFLSYGWKLIRFWFCSFEKIKIKKKIKKKENDWIWWFLIYCTVIVIIFFNITTIIIVVILVVVFIIVIIIIIIILIFLLPTYFSLGGKATEPTIFQYFEAKFDQRTFS